MKSDCLILKNVSKKFTNKIILENSNAIFQKGRITSLVAPNGRGKTTTISLISGFLKPDSGNIIFPYGINYKNISIVFGGEKNLYMKNTVEENIFFISQLRGLDRNAIRENLSKFKKIIPNYDELKGIVCEKLSHGQKRLVSVLSALVSDSKIIILDETTEGLDQNHISLLKLILKEIKKDKIIILCSQDCDFVESISDVIYFIKDNTFIENTSLTKIKDEYTKHYGGVGYEIFKNTNC